MDTGILIRKIYIDCPLCEKCHEVEERERMTSVTLKGEEVMYEERFYFCENAEKEESEFTSASMMNENLLKARNAYRIKKGLLTSDEIVAIRENYGLSQIDLARLLGWGEATVSRYESKAIQDEAYDTMLRLVKDNPLKALEFLKKNNKKFSEAKYAAVKEKIVEKLGLYGKEFLSRQAFESEYAGFDIPSELNGYAALNIDKIETIISYFAKEVSNLYKTKLMKLLWYTDVLAFIQNDKAMTGLVYRHEAMGALPVGHYSLMNLENLNIQEEAGYNYDSMLHIYPSEHADYSVLNTQETEILEKVAEKFRAFKAREIVDYMHEETAYKKTSSGEIIPFTLAKEIRQF